MALLTCSDVTFSYEGIPVLTCGMPPFTHMQNLRSDSNPDGTYHYTDITEDGQITVENLAEPSALVIDAQDLADYLPACALALSDSLTYDALSVQSAMFQKMPTP